MTTLAATVRDNPDRSRFELAVDGGVAVVLYRREPGMLTIFHTEVPHTMRERGLGSQLVQGALEQARLQGLKVAPRCSFVRHFIMNHPEFNDLLA